MRAIKRILILVFVVLFIGGCVSIPVPRPTLTVEADVALKSRSGKYSIFSARSYGRIINQTNLCLEVVVDGKVVGERKKLPREDHEVFVPGLLPPGETFSVPLFYKGSRERIVTVRGVRCEIHPKYRELVGMDTHSFRIGRGSFYYDQDWVVDRLRPLTKY